MFVASCMSFPPSRSYENDKVNYEAASGLNTNELEGQALTVQANQPWQKSDVHVSKGSNIKILALGKWSPAPTFNVWSGPEGGAGTGKEVPWINANALMAKIGSEGHPFEVGQERTLRTTGEGDLYFAINDPFDWVKDNTGSMQVTVYQESNVETKPNSLSPLQVLTHAPKRIGGHDKRNALVIGNSHYAIDALKNPQHDAKDIADALKQQGFAVILQLDSTQKQMEESISNFGRKLYQGGVGLFYYAGHGVHG